LPVFTIPGYERETLTGRRGGCLRNMINNVRNRRPWAYGPTLLANSETGGGQGAVSSAWSTLIGWPEGKRPLCAT